MRKSENEQHVICKLDFAKLWCKKTYIKCEEWFDLCFDTLQTTTL